MPTSKTTPNPRETFLEKMSDELTKIYDDLSEFAAFTPEVLHNDRVDAIRATLEELADEAEVVGDHAKAELLRNISTRFYLLHTIGTVESREKFGERAAQAFSLVETVLLTMDGFVEKNRGKIMRVIEGRRERY